MATVINLPPSQQQNKLAQVLEAASSIGQDIVNFKTNRDDQRRLSGLNQVLSGAQDGGVPLQGIDRVNAILDAQRMSRTPAQQQNLLAQAGIGADLASIRQSETNARIAARTRGGAAPSKGTDFNRVASEMFPNRSIGSLTGPENAAVNSRVEQLSQPNVDAIVTRTDGTKFETKAKQFQIDANPNLVQNPGY